LFTAFKNKKAASFGLPAASNQMWWSINPWADPSGKNKNKRTAGIDRYYVQSSASWFLIVRFSLSKWIYDGCQGLCEKISL